MYYHNLRYIYDLELPVDIVPKPNDDEVECFYLWDLTEVENNIYAIYLLLYKSVKSLLLFNGQLEQHLRNGEFKPNCGLGL